MTKPAVQKIFGTLTATSTPGDMVFVASNFHPDRVGDRVDISGMDLGEFQKNAVMLTQHDQGQLPVGKWKTWVEGDGQAAVLYASPIFSEANPMGAQVKGMVEEGSLSAVSIGFISHVSRPNAHGGVDHLKSTLLEISLVSVPCNPEAVRIRSMPETKAEAPETAPEAKEPTMADVMAAMSALAEKVQACMDMYQAEESAEEPAPEAEAKADEPTDLPAAQSEEPSEDEEASKFFALFK